MRNHFNVNLKESSFSQLNNIQKQIYTSLMN